MNAISYDDIEQLQSEIAELKSDIATYRESDLKQHQEIDALKNELAGSQSLNEKYRRQVDESLRLLNADIGHEKQLGLNQLAGAVSFVISQKREAKGESPI